MGPFESIEDMADAFGFAETMFDEEKIKQEQFYDTLENQDGTPPDLDFE